MKKVIINVDDFGISHEYNNLVIALINANKVSSASIIVKRDTAAAQEALSFAGRCCSNVSFGLHLDLSKYFNFDNTEFWGRDEEHIISNYRDIINEQKEAIKKDIESQFNVFDIADLNISHIDGHYHIHLFPEIRDILLPIMQQHEINKTRFFDSFYLSNNSKYKANIKYGKYDIKTPENFIPGIPMNDNEKLIHGINEVMIHASFGCEKGDSEFNVLMNEHCFSEAELISYNDL